MLRPLRITTGDIWWIDKSLKGYVFKHFDDAFVRYLPEEGGSEPREREKADKTGISEPFQTARPEADLAVEKREKSANGGPSRGLADEKGGTGEKTRVRTTARPRSDVIRGTSSDPLYTGPPVAVPDLGPDALDEHGEPLAANGSAEGGLTHERRAELAGWRRKRIADGEKPDDVDDALRMMIREEIADPAQVEAEFERVLGE
jgi:hypothetical protein